MTVAYCIAAHKRPNLTKRLISRLVSDDPNSLVILHYDQQYEPLSLSEVASPQVRVLPKRRLVWGGPELMQLQREMVSLALSEGSKYAVLLSGQDYPLHTVAGFEEKLSEYDAWLHCGPLFREDGSCTYPEGRRRYVYQWARLTKEPPQRALRGLDRLGRSLSILRPSTTTDSQPFFVSSRYDVANQLWWGVRSRGPGIPIWMGSCWMSLSSSAMQAIVAAPKRLVSYFAHVQMPAEAFFHTVLHSTPGLRFAPDNGWFMKWKGGAHPEVLTVKDLEALAQSDSDFARKFDDQVDSAILDHLDDIGRR